MTPIIFSTESAHEAIYLNISVTLYVSHNGGKHCGLWLPHIPSVASQFQIYNCCDKHFYLVQLFLNINHSITQSCTARNHNHTHFGFEHTLLKLDCMHACIYPTDVALIWTLCHTLYNIKISQNKWCRLLKTKLSHMTWGNHLNI